MNSRRNQAFEVRDGSGEDALVVLAPGWRDAVEIYVRTHGVGGYWQWLQDGGAPLVVYDQRGIAINQPLWN